MPCALLSELGSVENHVSLQDPDILGRSVYFGSPGSDTYLLTAQEEQLPDTLVTFFNDFPSSNPEIQPSEPPSKRRRVTKEPGTKASRIDDEEDYLTLALITIELVRPGFSQLSQTDKSLSRYSLTILAHRCQGFVCPKTTRKNFLCS